jgi:hypothetical protein
MQKINTVVAVYDTHGHAEEALRAFQDTGFDMKKLSIVGKDYHAEEHVIGFYNAGDRMMFWGKRGAFWGGFQYETALKADHFVVVAHGTLDEVAAAKRTLDRTGALSVDEHRAYGAA